MWKHYLPLRSVTRLWTHICAIHSKHNWQKSKYKLQINTFEISLQKKIEICYTVNNNFVAIFSFLTPNQVAFNFPHPCAPYIYGLPEIMRRSFNILFEQLGVRDTFEAQDFVDTLRQMHEEYRERELDRYNDMCYHQSETVMFATDIAFNISSGNSWTHPCGSYV